MARIPLTVAQRGLDTGSVVRYPDGSPIADAVGRLGNVVSAEAERWQRMRQEQDAFKERIVAKELDQALQNDLFKLQQEMPADASGFHDGFVGQMDPETGAMVKPGLFDDRVKEYEARVPPEMQERFRSRIQEMRLHYSGRAASLEYTARQGWYRSKTGEILTGIQTSIAQTDPRQAATLDAYLREGEETIRATGLPALEKEEMVRKWRASAAEAAWQAELAVDPEAARSKLGIDPARRGSLVDRIIGVESGGDPTAQNPNSSARGLGQFTNGTWIATVRKHEPQLAEGRSRAQLLALRDDPAISRRMTAYLLQENRQGIQAAGLEASDANSYLAHFAGLDGATRLLRADPSTPVSQILGEDAIRANASVLQGKTAGEVVDWAARKVGSSTSAVGEDRADPRYRDIPLDRRIVLSNTAKVQIGAIEREAKSRATTAYTAHKDGLELQIATGELVDERIILMDGSLNDGDKAVLIGKLRTATKEAQEMVRQDAYFTSVLTGSEAMNPYSSEARKAIDTPVERSDIGRRMINGDEEAVNQGVALSQRIGYAPGPVFQALRTLADSSDATERERAYQSVLSITATQPNAFNAHDGSARLIKNAQAFQYYVDDRNMTPQDALKRIAEPEAPENQKLFESRKKAARDLIAKMKPDAVTEEFDTWASIEPSLGPTPNEAGRVFANFTAAFEEEFMLTGDADLAKKRSIAELRKTMGRSGLFGRNTLQHFPPESFYPAVGEVGDQYRYIEEQAVADVKAAGHEVPASDVYLVPDARTRRDAERYPRSRVSYQLMFKDADGILQTVPGRFVADPVKARTDYRVRLEGERREFLTATERQARRPSALDPIIPETGETDVYRRLFEGGQ
jgi:hypothetical protein